MNEFPPPGEETEGYSHTERQTEMGELSWVSAENRWDNTANGKAASEVTVKYFARDNGDNAEAEARYKLKVHEPIEIVSTALHGLALPPVAFPVFVEGADGQTYLRGHYVETGAAPGSISAGTGTARATTRGFSIGEQAGVGVGSFNTGVSMEYQWSRSFESSTTDEASLNVPLPPGKGAYIAAQWIYQRNITHYRSYGKQGENRSPSSPPVATDHEVPSVPWWIIWDKRTTTEPTIFWKQYDAERNQGPAIPTGESPIYSPPAISGGSA